jgi:hypothetical protein
MKKSLICLLFFVLNISIVAQESSSKSWNNILHFNAGYSISASDWEFTHPYVLGSGSFTGRISGTFEESYLFSGGFEFSKGYLGYQANVGLFPAKFFITKQVDPGVIQIRNDVYSFTAIFLEADVILFPLGNPVDKITPYVKAGVSGMKTTGDIDNTILALSFNAGSRIFINENFGVDASIKFRYMILYNVQLTDQITASKGVSISSLIANVGILYRL